MDRFQNLWQVIGATLRGFVPRLRRFVPRPQGFVTRLRGLGARLRWLLHRLRRLVPGLRELVLRLRGFGVQTLNSNKTGLADGCGPVSYRANVMRTDACPYFTGSKSCGRMLHPTGKTEVAQISSYFEVTEIFGDFNGARLRGFVARLRRFVPRLVRQI